MDGMGGGERERDAEAAKLSATNLNADGKKTLCQSKNKQKKALVRVARNVVPRSYFSPDVSCSRREKN